MSYEFKKITDFAVGMSNSVTRTITEADVVAFGGLSMDFMDSARLGELIKAQEVFCSEVVSKLYQ